MVTRCSRNKRIGQNVYTVYIKHSHFILIVIKRAHRMCQTIHSHVSNLQPTSLTSPVNQIHSFYQLVKMANRGGNSRRAQQDDDAAITSVQCDGLVSGEPVASQGAHEFGVIWPPGSA